MSQVIAVVAATGAGVIGRHGGMPWRLSSDLQRFKQTTMGGTLVMGRRTLQSIGRILPGRQTVVLTRQPDWTFPGATVVHDASAALAAAQRERIFVIGGGEIYRHFWPHCDEIWWTRVWADLAGDTWVDLPLEDYRLVSTIATPMTARDDFPTCWQRWKKKRGETIRRA